MKEKLKKLRGAMTQKKLAKLIGISARAWSAYECGERIPRDKTKIKISEFFGLTVQEIFYD